ncbi:MAG: copper-binding protein [Proteobacteria bacterium]|nr:copper-binding protein [Pseudomonadota bacterium]
MRTARLAAALTALSLGAAPTYAVASNAPSAGSLVRVADHNHDHTAAQGAKGKGVVNSVDTARHTVNVSHDPIPSLGWPAMRMDFAVAPSVDLEAIQPATPVEFTVGKNKEGLPEIQALQAVKR